MPDIQAIDFDLGLRRCFGRRELMVKLLRRYLAEYHDEPQRIMRELNEGNAKAAGKLVHSLVSTAGTFGADHISQLARQLQDVIDVGEMETAQHLAVELLAEQRRVCTAAEGWLGAPN